MEVLHTIVCRLVTVRRFAARRRLSSPVHSAAPWSASRWFSVVHAAQPSAGTFALSPRLCYACRPSAMSTESDAMVRPKRQVWRQLAGAMVWGQAHGRRYRKGAGEVSRRPDKQRSRRFYAAPCQPFCRVRLPVLRRRTHASQTFASRSRMRQYRCNRGGSGRPAHMVGGRRPRHAA